MEGNGRNTAIIKKENKIAVKRTIYRYAPISRAEIATRLSLTPPTITNIVGEFIDERLVCELAYEKENDTHRGVGRKPILVDLDKNHYLTIGIHVGRDFTSWCVVNLRGDVLSSGNIEVVSEDYDEMVAEITDLILEIRSSRRARYLGVGITLPGIIDAHNGVIMNTGDERVSWSDKPLAEDISSGVSLPVRIDNNVRSRACAVSLFSPELLEEDDIFAFCHVSWGIACPLVLSKSSFRGETAAAGEIGQVVMDIESGKTLEDFASLRSIFSSVKAEFENCSYLSSVCSSPDEVTVEYLLEAEEKGDEPVVRIIDKALLYLGVAIANVVDFINPGIMFISGPLFLNESNFTKVKEVFEKYAFKSGPLKLINYDAGEFGGPIAAAASCIEKYFLRS